MDASSSSSVSFLDVTQPQVFINFRGEDVRNDFVDLLVHEMENANLNVFIDRKAVKGTDLTELLVEIEKSTVAVLIFSKNYTNAYWCLTELARINDCVARGTLLAIPVFYRIHPSVVKKLDGNSDFGFAFRSLKHEHQHDPETEKWEKSIAAITRKSGMELKEHGQIEDRLFIANVIVEVKKSLDYMKNKADQRKEPNTIQNIQYEAVPIRRPEAVENKQPEAVQNKQPVVTPQGCMFNVKQLTISNGFNSRYWTFMSISESTSEEAIKVAKMRECYYLELSGKFDTGNLTSGRRYEVVFVVKMEDTMSIWDNPATVQLMVPDQDLQEQELQFVDLPKNEWVEIQAGVFDARPHKAQTAFYLYQHDSKRKKTGLVVKGVIVRPMG